MIINLPQENTSISTDEFDVQLESLLAGDPENGIAPESPLVVAGQTRIEFDDAYRVVNAEFHQLDQLFQIQDNLVNLVTTFEAYKDKPEKLGGVLDLVNCGDGAAMVLIGKDAEDELPKAKDYPVEIALESAGERVKKVIKSIIDTIKKIISSIGNLAKKIIQAFKGHKKALEAEQKRFKGVEYVVGLDTKVKDIKLRKRSFDIEKDGSIDLADYLKAEKEQTTGVVEILNKGIETLEGDEKITEEKVNEITRKLSGRTEAAANAETMAVLDPYSPKMLGMENPEDVRTVLQNALNLYTEEKAMKKLFDGFEKALKSVTKDLAKADDAGEDAAQAAKDRLEFIKELHKHTTIEMRKTSDIALHVLNIVRVIKPAKNQDED